MISAKSFNGYVVFFTWLLSVSWMFVGPNREVWHVQPTSHLRVDGQTNVNQFHCIVPDYSGTDSLVCLHTQTMGDLCRVSGSMSIPISAFDCHHRMMTKDLQKTLKMEDHPTMRIDFKNFSQLPSTLYPGSKLTANAEIKLAGVTRRYNLIFVVRNTVGRSLDLKAEQPILFSDFRLIPPSKLGGTIRVKDELQVIVNLKLRRQ
jgi:hypothetical protein